MRISKLRSILSKSDFELDIHAFISSCSDSCNSLFICLNKSAVARLQLVQNAAACLFTGASRMAHITPVGFSLRWLPRKFKVDVKMIVWTFTGLKGRAPNSISDLLTPYISNQCLRTFLKSREPNVKLSFQAVAPRHWNALPVTLHTAESVGTFKTLKTFKLGTFACFNPYCILQ